jgi:hypothetical protein
MVGDGSPPDQFQDHDPDGEDDGWDGGVGRWRQGNVLAVDRHHRN